MKSDFPEIRQALGEGSFESAFRLCNREEKQRGENVNEKILYYGACALFGLGHIHQAEEWVLKYSQRTNHNAASLYLDAYLKLHARRFQDALLNWTSILNKDPSQTLADILIDKLKAGEEAVFKEVSRPDAFIHFVPLDPLRAERNRAAQKEERLSTPVKSGRRAVKLAGAGAILLLMLTGIFYLGMTGRFDRLLEFSSGSAKEKSAELLEKLPSAPEQISVIPADRYRGEEPRFIYGDGDDATRDYNQARSLAAQGLVNQSRYLLGKIELSNAGFELKERALLLRDLLPQPDLKSFNDNLTPEQIRAEPYLYRQALVHWSGVISGPVERSASQIRFEMEPSESRAKVDVTYKFTSQLGKKLSELKPDARLEVLGVVVRSGHNNRIELNALEVKLLK